MSVRISGLVTDGGEAASYNLRAPTFDELLALRARVTLCFEAGALATGAACSFAHTSEADIT